MPSRRPDSAAKPTEGNGPSNPAARTQGKAEKTITEGARGSTGRFGGDRKLLSGRFTPRNRLVTGTRRPSPNKTNQSCRPNFFWYPRERHSRRHTRLK